MRSLLVALVAGSLVVTAVRSDEPAKQAPKVVLKSPDGKKSYDLEKLVNQGPVLVRLTCACTGCVITALVSVVKENTMAAAESKSRHPPIARFRSCIPASALRYLAPRKRR